VRSNNGDGAEVLRLGAFPDIPCRLAAVVELRQSAHDFALRKSCANGFIAKILILFVM